MIKALVSYFTVKFFQHERKISETSSDLESIERLRELLFPRGSHFQTGSFHGRASGLKPTLVDGLLKIGYFSTGLPALAALVIGGFGMATIGVIEILFYLVSQFSGEQYKWGVLEDLPFLPEFCGFVMSREACSTYLHIGNVRFFLSLLIAVPFLFFSCMFFTGIVDKRNSCAREIHTCISNLQNSADLKKDLIRESQRSQPNKK
jgi:hypothetical protein